MTDNGLKVALALSGGTARSIVHVGVLKALEEEGLVPDLIAGTSGGSLIGALYTAGVGVKRLEEIASRLRWRDLAGLALPRMGLLSSEGISRFLIRHAGDPDFSELSMPLGVVTTDLLTGEKVLIREGRVADAVRASCSLPQIYSPVEYRGRVLVDGGLVEYLPVESAREMGADLVIAVNARGRAPVPDRPRNMVQVVFLVIGVVATWNAQLSEAQADMVIRPDVTGTGAFSLEAGPMLVASGYAATRDAIGAIRRQMARSRDELPERGSLRRVGLRPEDADPWLGPAQAG